MSLLTPFSRRLYLRIWLAVVGGVAVLTLAVGWAWRIAAEQNDAQRMQAPREVLVTNAQGDFLGSGVAQRVPGEGIAFKV
ncbi:MAG: two-component sensor histidine kinase, partial [Simplicispira sp.]|nr:two-component sensor histidine kinase [Simplicispira sp.]